jgi:hypothetical protein
MARLRKAGAAARPLLEKAAKSGDVEVATRAESLLQEQAATVEALEKAFANGTATRADLDEARMALASLQVRAGRLGRERRGLMCLGTRTKNWWLRCIKVHSHPHAT